MKKIPKNSECARCGVKSNLTIDHIIPRSMLNSLAMGVGSAADKFNTQILCQSCNVMKGNLLDPQNKKTLPTLRRYLDRWMKLYQVPRKKNTYAFRNLIVKHDTTIYQFISTKKRLEAIWDKQKRNVHNILIT